MKIQNPCEYSAALYIRLSKEDEREAVSESVENQTELLKEYAKSQSLHIYDIYIDDGVSGTTFDRPAFCRMIEDVEAGHINMVISKDMSRLGRDYIQTGYYMERYFPEKRVRYIALLDGVDTETEGVANDISPFRAIMNDMYAKDTSKKIRSVKKYKQEKGLFIGGKPYYGYKLSDSEKNKIVIDETAAAVVRRIFYLALLGRSCREIAGILNSEGVPTPAEYAGLKVKGGGVYSGLWSGERISDMLKNQVYIGNMVQGRVRKLNYKSKKIIRLPPEEWSVVEGTHEGIISKEEFLKVGELIKGRAGTRGRKHDYLLKGLFYCSECKSKLGVISRRLVSGEALYFTCRNYRRLSGVGCTYHGGRADKLTKIITEYLACAARSSMCAHELVKRAEKLIPAPKTGENDKSVLEKRLNILSKKVEALYEDRAEGKLCRQDFLPIYERIKSERAEIERKMAKEPTKEAMSEQICFLALEFLKNLEKNKQLLFSLIEKIELRGDGTFLLYVKFCGGV